MLQRSLAFDEAVVQSHKMIARCDILVDGAFAQTIEFFDGNVTIDDVAIRRRANLSITDDTGTLVPNLVDDLLTPAGHEMQLWRGIEYIDGTQELISLGIFGISDVQTEDSGQGLFIGIDGYDRSRKVSRARMPRDYTIAKGTPYIDAIKGIVTYRYPDATFLTTVDTNVTPLILIKQGDDPWEKAQSMAASIGYDLYFDNFGVCILTSQTDLATDAIDWRYFEGQDSTLLYAARRLNDEAVYNKVIVTGESTSNVAPVRGVAQDLDQNSPTYVLGPYGEVTYFYSSSFITTAEQAVAAARRQLAKSAGFFERIQTNTIVHPCHDIGDIIAVRRAKTRIDSIYIVDKITIPLTHSRGLNISTRNRRLDIT